MDSTTAVPPPVAVAHDERQATDRPIFDAIVGVARRFAAAVERSRQRRALAALDDRMLCDIGLTRAEFVRRTTTQWPRRD